MKNKILPVFLILTLTTFQNVQAQTGKDDALETMGALCGLLMYNTYATINSIGDAFEDDVYDAEYVKATMDEQVTGINHIVEQLTTLKNSGFLTDTSDITYIEQTIQTFEYLTGQAQALSDYTNTLSSEDADRFQNYRELAWAKIAELLGLE